VKRFLKILLIAAIVFSLIASSVFLILNSHHECHAGAKCRICLCIENAFGILKNIFTALSLILCVGAITNLCFKRIMSQDCKGAVAATPILLKVKLNN